MKKVSIKDISKAAGFSVTTVSMVLNGRAEEYHIAEKTKEKILRVAQELNYKPNMHARNLRKKHSNIIGLMVPTLYNRFFSEIAETFERLARENDKFALITVTHNIEKEELEAVEYFASQKADCIFTANPSSEEKVSALCSASGIRQIVLDSPKGAKDTVSTDNFEAARVLTRNLVAYMRQSNRAGRVYYVGGTRAHAVTMERLDGFRQALEDLSYPFSDDLFVPSKFEREAAHAAVQHLFETRDDVGGMFVNSLLSMEGVVRFFQDHPEARRNVHYGVFDFHPLMNLFDLNILSIKQDAPKIMEKAFEIYTQPPPKIEGRIFYIPYKIIPAFSQPRNDS